MISSSLKQWIAAQAGNAHAVPFYRDPILQQIVTDMDNAGGSVDGNQKNDWVVWAGNTDRAAGGDDAEAFAVMAAAADIIDSYSWYVQSGIAAIAADISGVPAAAAASVGNAADTAVQSAGNVLQKLPSVSDTGKWTIAVLVLVAVIAVANLGSKVVA